MSSEHMLSVSSFEISHLIPRCGERRLGTDQSYVPEAWQQDYLENMLMPIPHFLKRATTKKSKSYWEKIVEMLMYFAEKCERKANSKWGWIHQLTGILKRSFVLFQKIIKQEWWFSALVKVHYSEYYNLFLKTKQTPKKAFYTVACGFFELEKHWKEGRKTSYPRMSESHFRADGESCPKTQLKKLQTKSLWW